jgi:DHA1 family tetracycline resistance protein-like MFS transporter
MHVDELKARPLSEASDLKTGLGMLPLLFTAFLITLNWTICIPLFTPLIIRNLDGILPICSSIGFRAEINGMLLGSFFIAQIFGGSLIGNLSDHYGRKKVLLFCIAVNLISSFIWNYAIVSKHLVFMFAGQILDGLVGGSCSVVYSSMADLSNEKTKVRNFGLIAMSSGLGMVFGPFIGSRLIDPSNSLWCGYTTPYRLISLLCLVNMLNIWLLMKETSPHREQRVSALHNIARIPVILNDPVKRVLLLVVLLEAIAFYSFTQTFQLFLNLRFNVDERTVGNIYMFVGCCVVISQGVIVPFLSRFFKSHQVLSVSLIVNSLSFVCMVLMARFYSLYSVLPVYLLSRALDTTNLNALVSHLGKKDEQGTILGINSSTNSLAPTITGFVSGYLEGISSKLPDMMSALCSFMAWAVFLLFFYRYAASQLSAEKVVARPGNAGGAS